MHILGAVLAAWFAATAAAAQDPTVETDAYFPQQLSARDLLVHCASSSLTDRGRQRQRYCAGFVSGIEEAVRLLMRSAESPGLRLCVPAGESARRFRDAYLRYASRPAADLDRPAALVVVEALEEAYPCTR